MISYIQNLFYNDSIPPKWPVEKIHGRISKFFRDRFHAGMVGSIPDDNFVFVDNIAKGPFFNFAQWIWIFSEFWKIMKMIYLDCQRIDLFPVIKCCRDVLWRHINLLYIYLTVVYLAGWNYHSLKFSKISQNFIFSRKFTI